MKKMVRLIASALAASLAFASPAAAGEVGENVVLVELFTSQGCSSCPPADKTLGALVTRNDVIPLSFHVDYWDYLGWRDTFAAREHSLRQFAYRDFMGQRVVYTPQMIVHGRKAVPGYKPAVIHEAIAAAAAAPQTVRIGIVDDGQMIVADVRLGDPASAGTLWVASYRRSATVAIKRGENAGREITYHNVVDSLTQAARLSGSAPRSVSLPRPGANEGVAVWLQDDRTGRILAASFVRG